MKYKISHPDKILKGEITLTASKSESNRVLIIQALCEQSFEIKNLAAAEDTATLQRILLNQKAKGKRQKDNTTSSATENNNPVTYDVGAAGTTMRFLTAYLSTQPGSYILTGSERMKNRPIGILVNALQQLGADIEYLEKEGYPPLKIKGKELQGGAVEIDGSVSSQYISALLMIAPTLNKGIQLKFKNTVTSVPYILMTLKTLEEFGVKGTWANNEINIHKQPYHTKTSNYFYEVEGDWSSASYWYAMAALAKETNIKIKGLNYHPNSLQGDAVINEFIPQLGVNAQFTGGGYSLSKAKLSSNVFAYDFSDCPDIAQTIATIVAALNIPSTFTGLHTLRIKETDRTAALKNELTKFGTQVDIISDDEIQIKPGKLTYNHEPIQTYEDHRMAMAFAVLAISPAIDHVIIEHPEVVKKSYPDFWDDLKSVGFVIEEIN